MFGTIGMPEILIIAFVCILIFGPKKVPQLMDGLGQGVRKFKEGITWKPKVDTTDDEKVD